MTENDSQECAAAVLDTFHLIMCTVGPESHKKSPPELSIQQFRMMKVIERHNGASLSMVSERLGTTLSAASKVVDSLVEHGYVYRETDEDDRRRLILAVTDSGRLALERVHQQVLSCLAEKLAPLSPGERAMVRLAMDLLRSTITSIQLEPSVPLTSEK